MAMSVHTKTTGSDGGLPMELLREILKNLSCEDYPRRKRIDVLLEYSPLLEDLTDVAKDKNIQEKISAALS